MAIAYERYSTVYCFRLQGTCAKKKKRMSGELAPELRESKHVLKYDIPNFWDTSNDEYLRDDTPEAYVDMYTAHEDIPYKLCCN